MNSYDISPLIFSRSRGAAEYTSIISMNGWIYIEETEFSFRCRISCYYDLNNKVGWNIILKLIYIKVKIIQVMLRPITEYRAPHRLVEDVYQLLSRREDKTQLHMNCRWVVYIESCWICLGRRLHLLYESWWIGFSCNMSWWVLL